MTALRTIPDRHCKQCHTLFRPKREENVYCTRVCWYAVIRASDGTCESCGKAFRKHYAQQTYCGVSCKNAGITKDKTCTCAWCKANFQRPHGKARAYCSRACANSARAEGITASPERLSPRAVTGRSLHSNGYVLVRINGKKVVEHRLVIERALNRKLEAHERVHHKNGNRADNRPENLELWIIKGQSKKDPAGQRAIDLAREALVALSAEDRALLFGEFA